MENITRGGCEGRDQRQEALNELGKYGAIGDLTEQSPTS